jgi:predicted component of type VI protein secretion system
MSLVIKSAILAITAVAILSACEKPTAKFHPGDKVKVKLTGTTGVIALRLICIQ